MTLLHTNAKFTVGQEHGPDGKRGKREMKKIDKGGIRTHAKLMTRKLDEIKRGIRVRKP